MSIISTNFLQSSKNHGENYSDNKQKEKEKRFPTIMSLDFLEKS